jgi:nitroimidazol reductase NimA-like FMN-containing flavoprotein (pyridoxamine 5'-phosphate oxidase superfamily)
MAESTSFEKVMKDVRSKTFAVFNTVDSKERPHSTGIIFAVSPPSERLAFYIVTQEKSAKVRNIRRNPNVSLVVTFPHYYLRFIPDSTVMLRGTAEIIALDDERAQAAFAQKKMTRMNLKVDSEVLEGAIVIRIKPTKTVYVYGVGIGLNQMRKDPTAARYKVTIPHELLQYNQEESVNE